MIRRRFGSPVSSSWVGEEGQLLLGELALGDRRVRHDRAAERRVAHRRRAHLEPAQLVRRVARVLEAELVELAGQHRADAVGGDERFVGAIARAAGAAQVVRALPGGPSGSAVGLGEAQPGLVDGDDAAVGVEKGHVHAQRVERGGEESLARGV
jgi:hypothetical protein